MNAMRMATVLMILGGTAVPVAGQGTGMGMSGQTDGMMNAGMMQMCHAMMGGGMNGAMMKSGDGGMEGHAGMMSGSGMAGMDRTPGMDGMAGMMGMMQGMGFGPAALLAAADRLQLTTDQKTRLEALAQSAGQEHQNHMQAVMSARQEATGTLTADSPDLDAYQKALRVAADHMVQAHMAMTRASVEARGILTEEQRSQLQDSMALMGSMACGMMGGGEQGASGDHAQHHR